MPTLHVETHDVKPREIIEEDWSDTTSSAFFRNNNNHHSDAALRTTAIITTATAVNNMTSNTPPLHTATSGTVTIATDDSHKGNPFLYYQTQTFSLGSPSTSSTRRRRRNGGNRSRPDSSHPSHDSIIPTMKLYCLESLTPLDMLNLSNGVEDATGSRIWLGAQWFMECMVRPLDYSCSSSRSGNMSIHSLGIKSDDGADSSCGCSTTSMHNRLCLQKRVSRAIFQLRKVLLDGKRILELGSGTGASLISVGLASSFFFKSHDDDEQSFFKPSFLTLTDVDPIVLSLCQRNCDANLSPTAGVEYQVIKLPWGKEYLDDIDIPQSSQDTIVATDVIYDLLSLKPLMETASAYLQTGGYFVLSHIPRAAVDSCELAAADSRETLECEIRREAAQHNLLPVCPSGMLERNEMSDFIGDLMAMGDSAIRPFTLMRAWMMDDLLDGACSSVTNMGMMASEDHDYVDLDSVGASLMLFVKTKQPQTE